MAITKPDKLRAVIENAVQQTIVTDAHTHLYDPGFGDLCAWGIDELLGYHYLIEETFHYSDVPIDKFLSWPKADRADVIWKTLFLDRTPVSEACRGVLTTLERLGFDVGSRDLAVIRRQQAQLDAEEYIARVFEVARVRDVVMTNDPFDGEERPFWIKGHARDPRFLPALRVDSMLNHWDTALPRLREWGYQVQRELDEASCAEVRRFLGDWVEKIDPIYAAASLPPDFDFPESSARGILFRDCILPVCSERQLTLAMMIGVKRRTNPALGESGDSLAKAKIEAVERLCRDNPSQKFMLTMLSRENQHELCVTARKFRNLLVFGCWWFLNVPSLIEEMTRMRVELLGLGFIPQHSDARITDQLTYKWEHSRKVIAQVLVEQYSKVLATGWPVDEAQVRAEVDMLFSGNFWEFIKKKL
jgi:hypothetical protein